jgi:hypothetical protein
MHHHHEGRYRTHQRKAEGEDASDIRRRGAASVLGGVNQRRQGTFLCGVGEYAIGQVARACAPGRAYDPVKHARRPEKLPLYGRCHPVDDKT